jgi:hypothetical protein
MPDKSTYTFYQAYVINVRDFLLAEKEIKRLINRALKSGKKTLTVNVQTKVYALLYSTYSEASFMKIVLTPYGFDQPFVDEILRQESVQEKWLKCVELAFNKFTTHRKGSEVPNKTKELKAIIQKYIVDPSVLRNKIAHGQLTVALNSKNTNLNPDLTKQLEELDFITVYRWFEINKKLCMIIEDLIESPDRAHSQKYYSKYQELEKFISDTESWTIDSKMLTPSMKKPIIRQKNTGQVISTA